MLEFRVSEKVLFEGLKEHVRDDDTEEVIHNRMKIYHDQTDAVIEITATS